MALYNTATAAAGSRSRSFDAWAACYKRPSARRVGRSSDGAAAGVFRGPVRNEPRPGAKRLRGAATKVGTSGDLGVSTRESDLRTEGLHRQGDVRARTAARASTGWIRRCDGVRPLREFRDEFREIDRLHQVRVEARVA